MNNVIAPVDFGPATESVVTFASHLADALGTGLELVHVHQLIHERAFEDENREEVQALERRLVRVADEVSCDGEVVARVCSVSTHVSIADGLLAAAEGAGLLVLGQTESRGLWGWMQGDTTAEVLERVGCPVLVVPSRAAWRAPEAITLAIDARPLDEAAGAALREIATALGVELDVYLDVHGEKGPEQRERLDALLADVPHAFTTATRDGHVRLADYLTARCEAVDGVWLCVRHARRPEWRRSRVADLGERMAKAAPVPTLVLVDPPDPERRRTPGLVAAKRGFGDGFRLAQRV